MVDLTRFGCADERQFLMAKDDMGVDPRKGPAWPSPYESARIMIPLVNSRNFRYHAERLHELANRLDQLSREPLPEGLTHEEHEERQMLTAQSLIRKCSRAINAKPDVGNVTRLRR